MGTTWGGPKRIEEGKGTVKETKKTGNSLGLELHRNPNEKVTSTSCDTGNEQKTDSTHRMLSQISPLRSRHGLLAFLYDIRPSRVCICAISPMSEPFRDDQNNFEVVRCFRDVDGEILNVEHTDFVFTQSLWCEQQRDGTKIRGPTTDA